MWANGNINCICRHLKETTKNIEIYKDWWGFEGKVRGQQLEQTFQKRLIPYICIYVL